MVPIYIIFLKCGQILQRQNLMMLRKNVHVNTGINGVDRGGLTQAINEYNAASSPLSVVFCRKC